MAQTSFKFAHLASSLFRRKYSDYEIRLLVNIAPPSIDESDNCLRIQNFKVASNIMKTFGNELRKLSILNSPYYDYLQIDDYRVQIIQIVNEYCSKSLTQLNLQRINNETWPLFIKPFEKVESLDIEIQTDSSGMNLSQMFPNLKRLRVYLLDETSIIDCEIPHLKNLEIKFENQLWQKKKHILKLIENNPQIRSVVATSTPPEFVKKVQELLPNLENITLIFADRRNEPMHFANVKHCKLDKRSERTLKNLSFSQLETLEISYEYEFNVFHEFFRRHQNLSQLYIKLFLNHEIQEFETIMALLPHLITLEMSATSGMNIEVVARFIQSHPMLRRFQFPIHEISEADQEILRARFETNWNIESVVDFYGYKKFIFEKE